MAIRHFVSSAVWCLAALALLLPACLVPAYEVSDADLDAAGAAGAAGTGGAAGKGGASAATSAPICDSVFVAAPAACASCLGSQCCSLFKACASDKTCNSCVTVSGGNNCDANDAWKKVKACQSDHCFGVCH